MNCGGKMKKGFYDMLIKKTKFNFRYRFKKSLKLTSLKIKNFFCDFTWKEFWFIFVLISIIFIVSSFVGYNIWVNRYKTVKVPRLKGLMVLEGLKKLQELSLVPEIEVIYSSFPYGVILKQEPIEGEMIKTGRHVKLIVSNGPTIKTLENFEGKKLYYVEKKLYEISSILNTEIKIVNIEYRNSDLYPKGLVIEQYPAPGTDILLVKEIKLVISSGSFQNEVIVDSYVGLTEEEAKKSILNRGLIPIVEYQETEDFEKIDKVLQQKIEPGKTVNKGTEIVIIVGKRKEF